ncbi:branched-chain amino acid ABC transporter permease [Clostridiales bacterium BX7]|uniref:Branched-chain amino acid ABC transporter permease n=2 Tax=Feifania hominis TaxID=2763660 RepID=A0A926DBE3_9FIRM|nr:branched-chain amino acid ABC transporter permease [Feifania hominis]
MFLSLTGSGLAMGMIYAMLSVGLLLLIRSVGVTNYAQGDLLALGAFTAFFLMDRLNLNGLPMILLMIVLFACFGTTFMFTCYYPLRKTKWNQAIMVCTLGAGMVIQEVCLLVCGSMVKPMEPIIPGTLTIGSFVLQWQYIVVFFVSLLVMVAVYLLFDKLYAGRAMLAAAQNSYAANLIGIPSILTTLGTYIIVMMIVGFAGYLVAPIFLVRTTLNSLQSKAFASMVLGGFGSVKGAVIGSLMIGLIESYSTYFTTVYKDVIVFGVLLLTLLIRPQGIFGEIQLKEKA